MEERIIDDEYGRGIRFRKTKDGYVDATDELAEEEKEFAEEKEVAEETGDGTQIEDCKRFTNGELTCLLFPFDGAKLDTGKLAMWRLRTRGSYGGTWLSDYVPNRLGEFIEGEPNQKLKPDCPLIGQDGNIFNLVGIASRTLKRNGMAEEAKEMTGRVFLSKNYDDALNIIGEYVNITSCDEDEGMGMFLRK